MAIKKSDEILNPVWVKYTEVETQYSDKTTTKTFREFARKGAKLFSWVSSVGFHDGNTDGSILIFDGNRTLSSSNQKSVYFVANGIDRGADQFPLYNLSGELGLCSAFETDRKQFKAGHASIKTKTERMNDGRPVTVFELGFSNHFRASFWWLADEGHVVRREQHNPAGKKTITAEFLFRDYDGLSCPESGRIESWSLAGVPQVTTQIAVDWLTRSAREIPDRLFAVELKSGDTLFDRDRHTVIRNSDDAEAQLMEMAGGLIVPRKRVWIVVGNVVIGGGIVVALWWLRQTRKLATGTIAGPFSPPH